MTEAKETKQARRTKVLCKNNIYVDEMDNGVVKKIKAGEIAMLTSDEIDHFGDKVTKDIPKELRGE